MILFVLLALAAPPEKTSLRFEVTIARGLSAKPVTGRVLVVLAPAEDNAGLSFRNVDRTAVVSVDELEVAEVLRARVLLVSKATLGTLSGGEAT